MNKPFRWLIIEYAQTKLDVKHWLKHTLPVLAKTNQYRHVEIDLIYCPASGRPERAKWGRGRHSWIFYQFRSHLKAPLTHHVPRQPLLRLLHIALKNKRRKYYDGFMYGGHSNGEKIGRRPIRLATIQQFGRFLRRHKYYFPVIAFDSCDMGNELVIKHIRHSCEYLLAFPSDAPARSILETASFYKNAASRTVHEYLRRIAIDYMKHIRPTMKYPCLVLFHIPRALRAYQLTDELVKRKLIERFNTFKESANCREKFYVHDPHVAKHLRKAWGSALTDLCGHLIIPCKRHRPLSSSQRHAHRAQFHQVAITNE
jgi:hypothetical protein